MSKSIKNIKTVLYFLSIFTVKKNFCILHGQVFVMRLHLTFISFAFVMFFSMYAKLCYNIHIGNVSVKKRFTEHKTIISET